MYEICERYKTHNQRKIEKEKEDKFGYHMLKCHHRAIETYRREMDFECGGMKTVENISEVHDEAFQSARDVYTPHIQQYGKKACHHYIIRSSRVSNRGYSITMHSRLPVRKLFYCSIS
jgi:hypothetical protein